MRIYEMFMGPLDKAKPWSTTGLQGCFRFINKLWNILVTDEGSLSHNITDEAPSKDTLRLLNSMIKRVSENLDKLQFNTCVSEFMIFTNHLQKLDTINQNVLKTFIKILNPFMPHISSELWVLIGKDRELTFEEWPVYDSALIQSDTIKLAVQINGKRRDEIEVALDADELTILKIAKKSEKVLNFISGKELVKEIYVKGRLVNLVVR